MMKILRVDFDEEELNIEFETKFIYIDSVFLFFSFFFSIFLIQLRLIIKIKTNIYRASTTKLNIMVYFHYFFIFE